jgi:hypothetical protein
MIGPLWKSCNDPRQMEAGVADGFPRTNDQTELRREIAAPTLTD